MLDFGLAKLTSDGRHVSQSDGVLETRAQHFSSVVGTTVGTIAYMSPEQARGEDLDPRTDLFSFGVVLYEMATGRQSFPGHTTAVVFDGILNREPVPASSINTSMPADLDRLIAKALEKERTMRYQTAADLRADLQRLRRDSGTRRVAAGSSSGSGMEPATAQTVVLTASGVARAQPGSATSVSQPLVSPAPSPTAGGSAAATTPNPPPHAAGTAPAASTTSWIFAGVAVAIALVAVGAGIWVTMRPAPPAPPALATAPEAAAVTAPPPPAPPPDSAALSPTPASTAAPALPAAAATAGTPTSASTATPKPAATSTPPPTRTAVVKTSPPPAASAPPSKDVEAMQRLDVAKAKLASNLVDQAVADLRQIMLDYPGTAFAMDAALLAGEALEKAGRDEDAMAAYVEFDRRFPNHPRMADSQLRRARLMQRSKAQARQTEAYSCTEPSRATIPGRPRPNRHCWPSGRSKASGASCAPPIRC